MKKLYLFMVMLFVAIAANVQAFAEETQQLTLGITVWDSSADANVDAGETTVNATIDGAVVTLPQFLGSSSTVSYTVYENGSVDLTIDGAAPSGSYAPITGDFTFGEVAYNRFRIYVPYAKYAEDSESGKKYITLNGYADQLTGDEVTSSTWYDNYIYLPDDFAPAEANYMGVPYKVTAKVTSYDGNFEESEIELTVYRNGNVYSVPNFLGGIATQAYTIAEDGSISSSLNGNVTSNFTIGDYTFFQTWNYGGTQYKSYDSESNVITEQFWAYYAQNTYDWLTLSIPLPDYISATATLSGTSSTFEVAYSQKDGVITFPQIFGSSYDIAFTVKEDGSVSNSSKGDWVTGPYILGELGSFSSLYFSNDSYTTQKYASADGVQTLSLTLYDYDYNRPSIVFTLPEDFVPQELEKNVEIHAVTDGVAAEEGTKVHWDITTSGSTVTVKNPFSTSGWSLDYVMQNDGGVYSTGAVGGYYTKSRSTDVKYTYGDKSYERLYDLARKYDLSTKTFVWTVGLEETAQSGTPDLEAESIERFEINIALGDDFVPSDPIVMETLNAGVYVQSANGTYKPYSTSPTSTAKVNVAAKDERKVTLWSFYSNSVTVDLTWDENGNVTSSGEFPSNVWYTLGRSYYSIITIDDSKSKYVNDGTDEYLSLAINFSGGYNNTADLDVDYRLYFEKNSATANTISVTVYDEAEDSNASSSLTSYYSEADGDVTIEDFLDSEKAVKFHFHNLATGEEYGEVETDLAAGKYEGAFYALGKQFSTLTYEGDADGAYWYQYSDRGRKTNYLVIYATLDEGLETEQAVEVQFTIPSSVVFDEARTKIDVDIVTRGTIEETYSTSARALVDAGTIAIQNFGGSGKVLSLTQWEDGALAAAVDDATVSGRDFAIEGNFALAGFNFTKLSLNATNLAFYTETRNADGSEIEEGEDDETEEGEGEGETEADTITVSYFQVSATGTDAEGTQTKIYINVYTPEGFTPKEYEKNVEIHAVTDGVVAEEGTKAHWDITTNGSTVTVKNPFSTSGWSLDYVMQNDGSVYCTGALGGYYTKSRSTDVKFTYGDKSYQRLYDLAREYDAEKQLFKWTVGLEETPQDGTPDLEAESIERYVIYISLPEDLEATDPIYAAVLPATLNSVSPSGKLIQLASYSGNVIYTDKESSNTITLTSFMGKSTTINVTWDEEGNVTAVDGKYNSYVQIGNQYYRNFTYDLEKSKYVKNEQEEYVDICVNAENYYASYGSGYPNLENVIYRVYFKQNTEEGSSKQTLNTYIYDANDESDDAAYTTDYSYYTVENGDLVIEDLLEGELPATFHMYELLSGESYGEISSTLEEGKTYEGKFYGLDKQFSTFKYLGDSDAGWFSYNRTKYIYIWGIVDEGLESEQEIEIDIVVPNGVSLDANNVAFDVNVSDSSASQTIVMRGRSADSTLTIPAFAGSEKELTLAVWEDGVIEAAFDGEAISGNRYSVEGNFTFGDLAFTKLSISSRNLKYVTETVTAATTEDEGEGETETEAETTTVSYFQISADATDAESNRSSITIKIYAPEGYAPKEYEKNVEIHTVTDGVISEEADLVHWNVTTSGATVSIVSPFSAARTLTFPFTMMVDGSVECTFAAGGYFTTTYTYNGVSYARLFDYDRAYDSENNRFVWTVGLEQTAQTGTIDINNENIERFVVYVALPDDFKATRPSVIVDATAQMLVESRNGRNFYESSAATVDVANKEDRSVTVTSMLDSTVSLPLNWDEEGNLQVDESTTFSTSEYLYLGGDYYYQFNLVSEGSAYVKTETEEYFDLVAKFISGYYNKGTETITIRLVLEGETAESALQVFLSEWNVDENGTLDEADYETLYHNYTVEDGKFILLNTLDSDFNLEVTYYDNNTVVSNLLTGENVGPFYGLGNTFASINYEGDAVTNRAGWNVYEGYNYTFFYFTANDKLYSIEFYQPDEVTYLSGVIDLTADAEGDVEYFNLQGIRVNNPEHGIYIRRQGKNVSKVLVK